MQKILIANRGEIACRIMRTCAALGIKTVAVYSEADTRAMHVEMADEAVLLGAAPAQDSYLRGDKVIAAARETGAQAIHPGYGFLSENADFAQAVTQAGLIFIGPPVHAIRAMGTKNAAKVLMQQAGVPLVPGYHGERQDIDTLCRAAEGIGFPVLVKASAGGGGKGMRVVESAADLMPALEAAKREAQSAFGDDHLLIEKFLRHPRHVEVQVLADAHGHTLHLFERDCSVQRRHQKVIEEAPAPHLSQKIREKMTQAAVAAAKAVGYVGAGTVEFLLDENGEDFYFIEMNTRLQVEHPVTEMVTALDIVALQIHVARGEALPFTQQDLRVNGHAFEVRLYAEDPQADFLPGAGILQYLRFPDAARIDTGVREGDEVTIHYDPMIAKIITHGKTRDAALASMQTALENTFAAGPKTNLQFLRQLTAHESFAAGQVHTGFIEEYKGTLLPPPAMPPEKALLLAAQYLTSEGGMSTSDPWTSQSGWEIHGARKTVYQFKNALGTLRVSPPDDQLEGIVLRNGNHMTVMYEGCHVEFEYIDPLHAEEDDHAGGGRLHAPMPGKVISVHVAAGEQVTKGTPLVVIEAMKMEHTITAPFDGLVEAVCIEEGAQVDEKTDLVRIQE